jgi:hypothetical protein
MMQTKTLTDEGAREIIARTRSLNSTEIEALSQIVVGFGDVELSDDVRSELVSALSSSINENNAATIVLIRIRTIIDNLIHKKAERDVAIPVN